MSRAIQLLPGESMREYKARVALDRACLAVITVVRHNPGISSKDQIAYLAGQGPLEVERAIRALNRNESRFARIDYGVAKAKAGPWAGRYVAGWFPMDVAAYQRVMEWADWHSERVEKGVRRSRIERKLYAIGLTTKTAANVVAVIEERMGVPVDKLTEAQAQTFEYLAQKQGAEFIANGRN